MTLEQAIAIAVEAHQGTVDKAAAPYILHPLRIMLQMDTEEEMITAVLHDSIEDSELSLAMLREKGFREEIIEALDCLTRRPDEGYEKYIQRLSGNLIARKVKLADLRDNLNLSRLSRLTDKDWTGIRKYHQALKKLTAEESATAPSPRKPFTLFLGEI